MITLSLLLLILAAVCFLLVMLNVATPPRVNFLGLGLFLWVLSILLGQAVIVLK